MDEPYWCLKLVDTKGSTCCVYGTRGSLEPAFLRWAEGGHIDGTMVVIEGHENDAERCPLRIAFRADEVAGLIFFRM